MKKIFLLVASCFLFSCSNDEETPKNETENNVMYINNEKVEANFAMQKKYSGYYEIAISDKKFNQPGFSESFSFVGFLFGIDDYKIKEGTYTFSLDTAPNYNEEIHFFDAEAGHHLVINNGETKITDETFFDEVSSGKISIKKEEEIYTLTFNIQFGENTFKGIYKGAIMITE